MMPANQQQIGVSLKQLLAGFVDAAVLDADVLLSMLSLNSNKIKQGGLFLAVAGSQKHGLQYASDALKNGAAVVAYDPASGGELLARKYNNQANLLMLSIDNLTMYVGEIASRFYSNPSQTLAVVGITGTNGKTSVSHYLAQALNDHHVCGVIGTLGCGLLTELQTTLNTTPDAVSIQAEMARVQQQDAEVVAMEVSSHGLDQGRVSGVQFEAAVFTNLSHDHLDYHGSMQTYGAAKLSLFEKSDLQFAVINLDDDFSAQVLAVIPANTLIYGFTRRLDLQVNHVRVLHISNERHSSKGLGFTLGIDGRQAHISSVLLGRFNVDNLVATIATEIGLGVSLDEATASVAAVTAVAGRMQRVMPEPKATEVLPTVVVDFAHTPDALELALQSLREGTQGKLAVVFGCGGDRDVDKRAVMGAVAASIADRIIISNDNPRTEEPSVIVEQIKSGVSATSDVQIILDRQQAIEVAIQAADCNDTVLIAGKGHETYQDIAGIKHPFSDVECAELALTARLNRLNGVKEC